MDFKLTPEQVDQLVKDTILKSGIGKAIQDVIAKSLTGYDSPVDKAVREVVREIIVEMLRTEYRPRVDAAVRAAIEARLTKETLESVAEAAIKKIERDASDRY